MKYSPSHITYNIHIFSLTITIYLFIYTHLLFSNKNLYYSPKSFHLTELDLLWNIRHFTFSAYSTLFCKIFWHEAIGFINKCVLFSSVMYTNENEQVTLFLFRRLSDDTSSFCTSHTIDYMWNSHFHLAPEIGWKFKVLEYSSPLTWTSGNIPDIPNYLIKWLHWWKLVALVVHCLNV